jgi:hypothetical protein
MLLLILNPDFWAAIEQYVFIYYSLIDSYNILE